MATAIITRTYQEHAVSYDANGWMNATEVAEQHGRRIDHWLKTDETKAYIAELCAESNTPEKGYLKTQRGRNGGTWIHPELVVLFGRWISVKFAIWADRQTKNILQGNTSWANSRHASIGTNKAQNMILQDCRAVAGKATESHHYANEARLVNWVLTGEFKGLDRNELSIKELDLLAHLESRNAVLIGRGVAYDQRKPMLKQYAMDWQMAHTPLIG